MTDRGAPSPREHLVAFASLAPRAARAAWAGGIALALGLAVTAVWALSTSRLYRSEAVLLFERGVQSGVNAGDADSARQVSARLSDMLTSRQRLESAIKELHLYPAIVEQRSVVDAIEEMRRHVVVTNREGYTFRVSFDADSRELSQQALTRLVKGVVDEDASRRLREAEETKKFLDTERAHADQDLKAKESALSAFLLQHPALANQEAAAGGMIRAAAGNQAPPVSGGEIASLEMQRAQLEEALSAAGQSPRAGSSEPALDPAMASARTRAHTELLAAQKDLADKQAHYTNEHPDVKAALRRVADAEAGVRRAEAAAAAPRPVVAVEPAGGDENGGRIGALRRALSAVSSQISSLRSRSGPPRVEMPHGTTNAVAIDTEWTRLSRDVAEARERQSSLEAKQFQAQLMATLAEGGQGGRLVVIDAPFRPMRPIAGGRFKVAMVGGAASMLLALLAVAMLAAFDDRLYGARDVERVVPDGVVVVIPRLTEKGG
jgi:uncharacterized protein involved in exopolysaccharide biosynthesis